jgi:hypothetical protein
MTVDTLNPESIVDVESPIRTAAFTWKQGKKWLEG